MTQTENTSGLPHGVGSVLVRRANYWIVYRDLAGRTIQQNTHTMDREEAVRQLAVAALPALKARVAMLEQIANGDTKTAKAEARNRGRNKVDDGRKHGTRRRSVRHDAAVGGDGKAATTRGQR